jgi:hypothetical protein
VRSGDKDEGRPLLVALANRDDVPSSKRQRLPRRDRMRLDRNNAGHDEKVSAEIAAAQDRARVGPAE